MRDYSRRYSSEEFNIWPSFTDVITGVFLFLMFVFIVLIIRQFLYAARLSELEQYLGTIEREMGVLRKEFGGESGISIDVEQGRIVLQERILFDFGKSDIKPDSAEKLKKLGESLKGVLNRHPELLAVSIDGHTDNVGENTFNLELGSARAVAVLNLLEDENCAGIDPRKYDISANTYGEYKPVNYHLKDEPDAENRRIEIRIVPKLDELLRILTKSKK